MQNINKKSLLPVEYVAAGSGTYWTYSAGRKLRIDRTVVVAVVDGVELRKTFSAVAVAAGSNYVVVAVVDGASIVDVID